MEGNSEHGRTSKTARGCNLLVIHSKLPTRFNQQSCGSGFDEGKAAARREGSVGNHCSVRSSLTAKPVSPAPSVLHNVEANGGRDCNSANHIGLAIKLPFIVITDARLDTVGPWYSKT